MLTPGVRCGNEVRAHESHVPRPFDKGLEVKRHLAIRDRLLGAHFYRLIDGLNGRARQG
jgi:hypothetical protein